MKCPKCNKAVPDSHFGCVFRATGGRVTGGRKAEAARRNGARGGRPKKAGGTRWGKMLRARLTRRISAGYGNAMAGSKHRAVAISPPRRRSLPSLPSSRSAGGAFSSRGARA